MRTIVFARPKSVRRPLLPDLSLILSSSIPFSPRLKPISDTWTAHYPSRNPSHAIGATTVCLSHLISLEWPAWSRLASSSTYLTSYRGSTAPLSLQSILGMTFAIGTMMMFSFPVRSGGRTPAILTIAGSDSGGSAGIQVYLEFGPPYGSLSADSSWYMVLQADLKTFTVLGCYGASVMKTLTAQIRKGYKLCISYPPRSSKSK